MAQKFDKKMGILGGPVPWASAYAVLRIVESAQWDHHAVEDNEYPKPCSKNSASEGFRDQGYRGHRGCLAPSNQQDRINGLLSTR